MPALPVEVTVPSLLKDCTDNHTRFLLEAEVGTTVAGALQLLLARHPLLRLHLYDEQERQRKHVLIYYNQDNIAWLEGLDTPLRPGDSLSVVQNVSGG
jgi:molybdopterin converting factor small subunit